VAALGTSPRVRGGRGPPDGLTSRLERRAGGARPDQPRDAASLLSVRTVDVHVDHDDQLGSHRHSGGLGLQQDCCRKDVAGTSSDGPGRRRRICGHERCERFPRVSCWSSDRTTGSCGGRTLRRHRDSIVDKNDAWLETGPVESTPHNRVFDHHGSSDILERGTGVRVFGSTPTEILAQPDFRERPRFGSCSNPTETETLLPRASPRREVRRARIELSPSTRTRPASRRRQPGAGARHDHRRFPGRFDGRTARRQELGLHLPGHPYRGLLLLTPAQLGSPRLSTDPGPRHAARSQPLPVQSGIPQTAPLLLAEAPHLVHPECLALLAERKSWRLALEEQRVPPASK